MTTKGWIPCTGEIDKHTHRHTVNCFYTNVIRWKMWEGGGVLAFILLWKIKITKELKTRK